jgi:hypothetical protein
VTVSSCSSRRTSRLRFSTRRGGDWGEGFEC